MMKSELEISKPRLRRLFIVQSWLEVQKCLSLIHWLEDSNGQDFLIVENTDRKPKNPKIQESVFVVERFGHSVVTQDDARLRTYDEVHLVPSSVMSQGINLLLGSLAFSRLIAHSDGLRNGIFIHPRTGKAVNQIIKFGLNLEEEALRYSTISREVQSSPVIVSISSILKTWQAYAEALSWVPRPLQVSQSDLLVSDRGWGSSHYRIKPGADLFGYLSQVLDLGKTKYRRIIFKPSLTLDSKAGDWESAVIKLARLSGLEYITWDDLVAGSHVPDVLSHPEAQFFLGGLGDLGGLFAFDSSLCLLFGTWSERTRVHWPDGADTQEIFEHSRTCDLVAEQSRWMRRSSDNPAKPAPHTSAVKQKETTDGLAYFMVYFESLICGLEEIQESLEASASWRLTKPIRAFGKLFLR